MKLSWIYIRYKYRVQGMWFNCRHLACNRGCKMDSCVCRVCGDSPIACKRYASDSSRANGCCVTCFKFIKCTERCAHIESGE
jgi:hypothetical protein